VLWALAQPAAIAGLLVAFGVAVALRTLAQRMAAQLLGLPRRPVRSGPEPLGLIAATFLGTGWGRPVLAIDGRRSGLVVVAGPAAVLAASQAVFAAHQAWFPHEGLLLRLNRPSDVLHGAVAPTRGEQVVLSLAVGLLCFALLALLPVPPLDGYRLASLLMFDEPPVGGGPVERLATFGLLLSAVVPVAGRPPVLAILDLVAGPLLRAWA
jgi:hypothetical protein